MRSIWNTLLAAGMVLAVGCLDKHPAPVRTDPPIVQVARPVEREVTDFQIFTARTQAEQSVDVKARVTGYLTDIKFKDGDEVKKDQVLFIIDKRPYKNTLDQAEADLQFASASVVKARAEYDIGLNVQKQDKGAISEQEIVKRKGGWEQSVASVEQAKAKVEQAKLNYGWCEVTAPIDGRANRHFIDVGNIVDKDMSTLTNIVSLKPTWAYFDVDEITALRVQQLMREGKIKSARTTELPVEMALGTSQGFPFNGHIDFISNQLDPNTGSLRVRAIFANQDGTLQAGLFGRIRVPVGPLHRALLVRDEAVGASQGQNFVLVVDDKNQVEYRAVEIGQLFDSLREVKRVRTVLTTGPDGKQTSREVEVLKPSERILVDGLQRVRPGATVNPQLVDMETLLLDSKPPSKSKP